jgi:serine/threonine-protein kinase
MPEVGDVVDGRYRLTAELGRGGMAVVYAAQAEKLGREVALKVLFPRWASDRKQVSRFAREARAASQIDHDNVVKVYDFGYAPEGFYFLAMERLEGLSLQAIVHREGRLSGPRALRLLLEIARGLSRAHALGVVHRDLKPENVMVQEAGEAERVTLVDFGLSKIQAGRSMITGEGDVIGTPDFMAPEQWQGKHVDARADVYAFGVMAYEMLSGELPFGGGSLVEKLQQHLYTVPLELKDHPKTGTLPAGLSDLIMRCMAKDPLDRPVHMGQVLERLRAIDEAGRALSAEPTRIGALPAPTGTVMAAAEGAGLDARGLRREVRRLARVRQQRLRELAERAFSGALPEPLRARLAELDEAEARLGRCEEEAALAEAALEEARRAHRAKEAELRARLVEANLLVAVEREALLDEVTDPGDALRASDTIAMDASSGAADAPAGAGSAEDALARAEARLAAFVAAPDPAVEAARARLEEARRARAAAEAPLAPLHDRFEDALRRSEAAGSLDALAALDATLASYRSRLAHLERRAGQDAAAAPEEG